MFIKNTWQIKNSGRFQTKVHMISSRHVEIMNLAPPGWLKEDMHERKLVILNHLYGKWLIHIIMRGVLWHWTRFHGTKCPVGIYPRGCILIQVKCDVYLLNMHGRIPCLLNLHVYVHWLHKGVSSTVSFMVMVMSAQTYLGDDLKDSWYHFEYIS